MQAELGNMVMFHTQRRQTTQPATGGQSAPAMPATRPKPEDGLDRLCLSDVHAIEVEEISEVEFVREWGRAITKVALAHAIGKHADKTD